MGSTGVDSDGGLRLIEVPFKFVDGPAAPGQVDVTINADASGRLNPVGDRTVKLEKTGADTWEARVPLLVDPKAGPPAFTFDFHADGQRVPMLNRILFPTTRPVEFRWDGVMPA